MDTAAKFALADRLFAAVEGGDLEGVRDCYAPELAVWHNFDQKEQTRDESLQTLAWLCKVIDERRYEITRREELPDGILQLHILRGRAVKTGAPYALPAAIVVTMAETADGNRITRLDEYLDPGAAPK